MNPRPRKGAQPNHRGQNKMINQEQIIKQQELAIQKLESDCENLSDAIVEMSEQIRLLSAYMYNDSQKYPAMINNASRVKIGGYLEVLFKILNHETVTKIVDENKS